MKKITVAIMFGGKSTEHEVSLQSAKNIISAIDKNKYSLVLIGIEKNGAWKLFNENKYLLNDQDPKDIKLEKSEQTVVFNPDTKSKNFIVLSDIDNNKKELAIDVVFPVLHGACGEDGTIQGLLKLAEIPFVGADVLGSSIGMDKDVMKRLLREAKIPIGKFKVVFKHDESNISFDEAKKELGLPMFIKPANAGSSVGVNKVNTEEEFILAIKDAFLYDNKILIEEAIIGREVECAILGNEEPQASGVGEIILKDDFYSYDTKYISEEGAKVEIPAHINEETKEKIQEISKATFKVLCCSGMARVDSFLKDNGEVLINEINTIPGFTNISMYPTLWKEAGLSYANLIDELITLALDKSNNERKIKSSFCNEKLN